MPFTTGRLLKFLINYKFIYCFADAATNTCQQANQLTKWANKYKQQLSSGPLTKQPMIELFYINYQEAQDNQYIIQNIDDMKLFYKMATKIHLTCSTMKMTIIIYM